MSADDFGDLDDINNDPKFGPMLRKIESLDLPSAFSPIDPDAPAEELPAASAGVIATGGHSSAKATCSSAPLTKGDSPKEHTDQPLVHVPEAQPSASLDEQEPAEQEIEPFVHLPEGDRAARTRELNPIIPMKPRRRWLWLLAALLIGGAALAAAYFNRITSAESDRKTGREQAIPSVPHASLPSALPIAPTVATPIASTSTTATSSTTAKPSPAPSVKRHPKPYRPVTTKTTQPIASAPEPPPIAAPPITAAPIAKPPPSTLLGPTHN